ncbi:MAG: UDP-N-acetylmuramoyl-tripeptide--D-alanyl-D-alanine ligase [Thermodesulfobacteriota bacterium]|nr:UDP-N-acetylmuramoyl-tripeptide--D-alanyl-D-alanine ligase [Thermodesulfobacteriota bacterium]
MNDDSISGSGVARPVDFSLTARDVLKATGGTLVSGSESIVFDTAVIDSRSVLPGNLFVAIRGERHDGHTFIPGVIRQGIRGVVINQAKTSELRENRWNDEKVTCVAVDDTIRALGDLAAYQRRRSDARVIGITGSNGKTTTRRMAAAIFGRCFETLASRGNYNNEIGLPLTLLGLKPGHQWIVLELGMNHFGEIRRLSRICRPDIGIITSIAPCHLEGVGSIEGVVRAKAEILENIPSGGTVILNRDDPYLAELGNKIDTEVLFFGESDEADIRAHSIRATGGEIRFTLELPDSRTAVRLPATGRFMVSNALAAAAAGYLAGLSCEEIQNGLYHFRSVSGRMNVIPTKRGITIIDDTYNANPASMEAAINTLATVAGNDRSILVVGDMLELGDETDRLHRQVGKLAGRAGITRLYVTGPHAGFVAEGARAGGMDKNQVITGEKEAIITDLKKQLKTSDWMLVKGSRGSAMEAIVGPIKEWASHRKDEALNMEMQPSGRR